MVEDFYDITDTSFLSKTTWQTYCRPIWSKNRVWRNLKCFTKNADFATFINRCWYSLERLGFYLERYQRLFFLDLYWLTIKNKKNLNFWQKPLNHLPLFYFATFLFRTSWETFLGLFNLKNREWKKCKFFTKTIKTLSKNAHFITFFCRYFDRLKRLIFYQEHHERHFMGYLI